MFEGDASYASDMYSFAKILQLVYLNQEKNDDIDKIIKESLKKLPGSRYEIQELESLFIKSPGLAKSRRVLPSPENKKPGKMMINSDRKIVSP